MPSEPKHLRELWRKVIEADDRLQVATDAYETACADKNSAWAAYEAARAKPKEQA